MAWAGAKKRVGGQEHHRRRVTRGGGQAESARRLLRRPSAAKARPASADATLEERLCEGQPSRKRKERRPASSKGGSIGGAEGKGDLTRSSASQEADK